jgi:pre-mRNA-splicing factor ATP-dependent RNA helicase DHX15/PRP43
VVVRHFFNQYRLVAVAEQVLPSKTPLTEAAILRLSEKKNPQKKKKRLRMVKRKVEDDAGTRKKTKGADDDVQIVSQAVQPAGQDEEPVSDAIKLQIEESEKVEQGLTNPLNGRPFTKRYREILDKRRELPVHKQRAKFMDRVTQSNIVVLVGETGSGKTTQ